MGVTAIIGLQWGDEGKGKIVDAVGKRADMVVRCQGGANAGHTVIVDGRKFVLHLVPSGILRDGVACVIGNGVAVDLDALTGEIADLERAGIKVRDRLLLSRRAHIVLPFHKRIDANEESARGGRKIGTTLRGIGPCYRDKYARVGIRVGDLLSQASLDERLAALKNAWSGAASGIKFDVEETESHCRTHLPLVKEIAADTGEIIVRAARDGKEILLEGAQGFLLDIDHGTYPFVTSSNTGAHGLASGSGLPPASIGRVVGVLKAYTTRVGEGPMPTEMEEPYQTLVRERGGEFGSTTGRPRRCGWLDLVALKYACALNGVTSLAVTKLDTLSGLDMLRVCPGYDYAGKTLDSFPSESEVLARCVPHYTRYESWGAVAGLKRVGDLPEALRRYVGMIADQTRSRLETLSLGPSRDDTIEVRD